MPDLSVVGLDDDRPQRPRRSRGRPASLMSPMSSPRTTRSPLRRVSPSRAPQGSSRGLSRSNSLSLMMRPRSSSGTRSRPDSGSRTKTSPLTRSLRGSSQQHADDHHGGLPMSPTPADLGMLPGHCLQLLLVSCCTLIELLLLSLGPQRSSASPFHSTPHPSAGGRGGRERDTLPTPAVNPPPSLRQFTISAQFH